VTTYVLVHGAFRGGWAWDRVRSLLERDGHRVLAPSLTGMGDRAHLLPAGCDRVHLATWVEDLVRVFDDHDLDEVVVVGHSQAGMVLVAAAEHLHERIAELVLLDAPVPDDGERGIDLNPPGVPSPRPEDVDLTAALPARPVGEADGFTPQDVAWVNARLCATPIAPSFEPVRVGADGLRVPRRHVFFSDTPQTYPCWSTRARLDERGVEYEVVDGPHDLPLTDPAAVVALLRRG
jgi:pimeloyl-ACP methyl ester carboxylesterase